ncbi:hypothetical protein Bbelb_285360 [Branchiostoma belcheri]|nr:hypothetical protein Bbelb_285360 [Branchiostoma belcheri]
MDTSKPFEFSKGEQALETTTSKYMPTTLATLLSKYKATTGSTDLFSSILATSTRPPGQNSGTRSVLSARLVLAFVGGFALTCLLAGLFFCCRKQVETAWKMLQGSSHAAQFRMVTVRAMPNPVYRADTAGTVLSGGGEASDDQDCPTIQPYAETPLSQIQAMEDDP